jgi:transcriptional regulator with XRE-family HTH domain
MANMKRLGARLRALRDANGLTQMQLSRDTQVSQNYISSLERGEIASPDPELLFALFTKFGLEPNDVAREAGWWTPRKDPKVPEALRLTFDRLLALPATERDPLVTILKRMVDATYRDAQVS